MKKVLFYISVLLVTVYVVAFFIAGKRVEGKALCGGMDVVVEENDSLEFITPGFIRSEVKRLGLSVDRMNIDDVDAQKIEDVFNAQYYVENAECFKLNNRRVQLTVVPVRPVMRVFENDSITYYINRKGKKVPASADFFVDVPVVRGNFSGKHSLRPEQLLPLIDYLAVHPEENRLVSAIEVKDSSNVFIIPAIIGHVVNLGAVDNLDAKFSKLKRMYSEVMPVKGWNAYDTITLKWNNQIVATKRNLKSRLWVQTQDIGGEELPDPSQEVAVVYSSDTSRVRRP